MAETVDNGGGDPVAEPVADERFGDALERIHEMRQELLELELELGYEPDQDDIEAENEGLRQENDELRRQNDRLRAVAILAWGSAKAILEFPELHDVVNEGR